MRDYTIGGIPRGNATYCVVENWVEMCGPLLTTLTFFVNKICDFQYSINDLTLEQYPLSDLPYT